MPLVPAKCTQCGANLEVDPSLEAAVCPNCKTPFITERAINNYNTTNVVNNVTNIDSLNADVVNVASSDSVENLLRTAETFVKFGDWEKAGLIYKKITETYPYEAEGWYGLLRASSSDFSNLFADQSITNLRSIYNGMHRLYDRLAAVVDSASVMVLQANNYISKLRGILSAEETEHYNAEHLQICERISTVQSQLRSDLPAKAEYKKPAAMKAVNIIWIVWTSIAFLISFIEAVRISVTDEYLETDLGLIGFSDMDTFLSAALFCGILMLMLKVIVSVIMMLLGIRTRSRQKRSTSVLGTSVKFITHASIIEGVLLTVLWLITTIATAVKNIDAPLFQNVDKWRIDSVLFHVYTSANTACWIGLLLILFYGALNYFITAWPMLSAEKIAKKKTEDINRNNMLVNQLENLRKKLSDAEADHEDIMRKLKIK